MNTTGAARVDDTARRGRELTFDPWEWVEIKDGNRHAFRMARRHYSAKKNKHPKVKLFIGPGGKLALLTRNGAALFAWRKYINDGGQEGVNCAIYRLEDSRGCVNTSHAHCSSNLILRAEAFALQRWPGERLYTYIDATEIKSANPGYCFKRAGWRYCGVTAEGLHILEKLPLLAQDADGRAVQGEPGEETR